MLNKLISLHQQAPKFIEEYERKQRTVAAQLHIYSKATCETERTLLSSWILNNNTWLEQNQEKYYSSKRVLNVTIEELQEINELHERIINE